MWDLSEIVDCVILDDPRIRIFFPKLKVKLYPNHVKIFPKFNSIWHTTKDFKSYLLKSVELMTKGEF